MTTPTAPSATAPAAIKIFGREPAAWIGLIESALTLLLAFALGVSQTTYGPIMAVVTALFGLYVARATKDTLFGVIVGLTKSLVVLGAVYGLTLSDNQTAALVGLAGMVVTFFQRTQTSPAAYPVDPNPAQVVVPPVAEVAYEAATELGGGLTDEQFDIYDARRRADQVDGV